MGWPLVAWCLGALALAYLRVPYDDEWFSLELAFQATREQFWFALGTDVHPPWLALLDRGVAQVCSAPVVLNVLRIAASACAIDLLSRTLARPLGLPRSAFAWAAWHPIVLFYAGCTRWYPCLLLAHALRVSALWQPRPALRAWSFVCGAALGSLASYLDLLFLVHDSVWFWLRGRRAGASWTQLSLTLFAAMSGVLVLLLASPLHGHVRELSGLAPDWQLTQIATWAGLGVAGESALPWPAPLLGITGALALLYAMLSALRVPDTRAYAGWLLSYGATWLFACGFGVWHPRYSLLLWLVCALLVASQWQHARPWARALIALAALQLALALALAYTGRGFFKADLNRLTVSDCAQLSVAGSGRALISPAPRLAALVRAQCPLQIPIVEVASVRIVDDERAQLASVRAAIAHPGVYWLATIHSESSLTLTQERVRQLLDRQCSVASEEHAFGEIPHPGLRPERPQGYTRFGLQRFVCPLAR